MVRNTHGDHKTTEKSYKGKEEISYGNEDVEGGKDGIFGRYYFQLFSLFSVQIAGLQYSNKI